MRSVYVDVLITVNIFVDFMLLLCTKRALCAATSYKRLFLGALAGGAQSLIALFPTLPWILNIIIDIVFAAAIIFAAFGRAIPKIFIQRTAVFFTFSFVFCGIMMALYEIFKPNGMEIYNDVVYFNISPVLLIIFTLVCYYILKLIRRFTKTTGNVKISNVEIAVNGQSFCFAAKVDTGCTLTEPFSGNYVIVAEESLFPGFAPDEHSKRVIPFESLGGSGIIMGFPPDEVKINGKIIDRRIYIGLCKNVLKGSVKALMPYELNN